MERFRGEIIKDQYVGDINDYFKYAFLRSLPATLNLVVCWMKTADDGGNDGRKRRYLEQPKKYRDVDTALFDDMRNLVVEPKPDIAKLESSGLLPASQFFAELLSDEKARRLNYFQKLTQETPADSVVFFDPDNGLEVRSTPKGRKGCSKFLFLDELALLAEQSRSVIVYQHFGRVQRDPYIEAQLSRMRRALGERDLFALAGSHVAFLVGATPSHGNELHAAASDLCLRWSGLRTVKFIG